jgi:hypothetical protein
MKLPKKDSQIEKTRVCWRNIISRCKNSNNPRYKDYGGRGVEVCDRWLKFENFLEDMGVKPGSLSIDRIDNNKGYSKNNCRWATKKEQCRNQRTNVVIFYEGRRYCLSELSEAIGVNSWVIKKRLEKNWPITGKITWAKKVDISDFVFSDDKASDIERLRKIGLTMQQIADTFKISRQRVKQIIDSSW